MLTRSSWPTTSGSGDRVGSGGGGGGGERSVSAPIVLLLDLIWVTDSARTRAGAYLIICVRWIGAHRRRSLMRVAFFEISVAR